MKGDKFEKYGVGQQAGFCKQKTVKNEQKQQLL